MKLQIYRVPEMQSLTLSKKRSRHTCFLVNFAKFLITPFSKNPLDGCFCIDTRSVYCPTTILCLFTNDITNIFWLSFFSTKVFSQLSLWTRKKTELNISNTYLPGSTKPILHRVKHLGWSFI